ALRLRAALRWSLKEEAAKAKVNPWEYEEDLLKTLGRVERVEVTLGRERRIWYLNLLKGTRETLSKMGYGKLFQEEAHSAADGPGRPA
ncbi:transposase, partial [mine drainage metagenome]